MRQGCLLCSVWGRDVSCVCIGGRGVVRVYMWRGRGVVRVYMGWGRGVVHVYMGWGSGVSSYIQVDSGVYCVCVMCQE